MNVEFSADEAFILGERVEKKAAEFYRRAAMEPVAGSIAELFNKLATMETGHAEVFAAMRGHPSFGGKAESEAFAKNLWPMLADSMIQNLDEALPKLFKENATPQDIIRGAMNFERDTIVFLLVLRDMLGNPEDKTRIDLLVKEEMGHLISLGSELATL